MHRRLNRPKLLTISRSGLLEAILVPLFVLTALAAGLSSMGMKDTGEKGTMPFSFRVYQDGDMMEQEKEVPARFFLEFHIEGESKKVYFKPGWLPGEKHPSYNDQQGYEHIVWGPAGAVGAFASLEAAPFIAPSKRAAALEPFGAFASAASVPNGAKKNAPRSAIAVVAPKKTGVREGVWGAKMQRRGECCWFRR